MLTEAHKDDIKRTWRLVMPILDTAVELFYGKLFDLRPELRGLFPHDMRGQQQKLGATLNFAVKSLDWPANEWAQDADPDEDLFLIVLALGRRHKNLYKVTNDHYGPVGEALLWALDQGLGAAFTPQVKEAWTTVYTGLAKTMMLGAMSPEPQSTPATAG